MASCIIAQPRLVSNATSADFTYFLTQLKNYLLVASATEAQELPVFLSCLPMDAMQIYEGLPDPKQKLDDAVARFKEYFSASTSILLRRREFYSCQQSSGESITAFVTRLRRLAADCSFTDAAEITRDMFIMNVSSPALREKFLQEDPGKLSLELAIAKAQAFERAFVTSRATASAADVCSVQHQFKGHSTNDSRRQNQSVAAARPSIVASQRCFRCGSTQHKANYAQCPAKSKQCRGCGKSGHYRQMCRSELTSSQHDRGPGRSVARVATVDRVQPEVDHRQEESFVVSAVASVEDNEAESHCRPFSISNFSPTKNSPEIEFLFKGKKFTGWADSGSSANIMPLHCIGEFNSEIKPTKIQLKAYGGANLKVIGELSGSFSHNDISTQAVFIIVDYPEGIPLVSYTLCQQHRIFHTEVTNDMYHYAKQNGIFQGIGEIKRFIYDIKLTSDYEPILTPPRRLPAGVLPDVRAELDRLCSENIIEPVDPTEQVEWLSPMVVARRKSGAIRIVIDYRHLNKYLSRTFFQMPTTEDILLKMEGAKFFTVLDARSGYHQIAISNKSKKLLTFSTPFGPFTYNRMPMGLKTACEIFQRVMTGMLQGLKNVNCYLDDIVITGSTRKEHDENVKAVLDRLLKYGVKLNAEKCQFTKTKISFLGHVLSEDGITPDPEKCLSLDQAPRPENVKQLRSFLGLATFTAQKFVPNFAAITAPLWALTQKPFEWNDEAEKAFNKVKKTIRNVQALNYFSSKLPVTVYCDASKEGYAGVVVQNDRPILFASRKTSDFEQRWSQTERETGALLFALTRFKQFLFGVKTTVCSDNLSLTQFIVKPTMHHLSSRLQRILLQLQEFDFDIKHIKGSQNCLADFLSRYPESNARQTEDQESICFILYNVPLSRQEFVKLSLEDKNYQQLVQILKNKAMQVKLTDYTKKFKPHLTDLSLSEDGLICFHDRLVVPENVIPYIFNSHHTGHAGIGSMQELIKKSFFWPGMQSDVKKFVYNCSNCVSFSGIAKDCASEELAKGCHEPNDVFAIDLVGPSERLHGRVYLSVIDYYSRFPFLYPLKNATASEVVGKLKDLFSLVGPCKTIVSDNGTIFSSAVFSDFTRNMGIRHKFTSVYRPSSNGIVERFHGTLKSKLDRILLNPSIKIDDAIFQALFDIRCCPNTTTKQTPFYRFLGRNPKSPAANALSEPRAAKPQAQNKFPPGTLVLYRRGRVDRAFLRRGKVVKVLSNKCVVVKDFKTGHSFSLNSQFCRRDPANILSQQCVNDDLPDLSLSEALPSNSNTSVVPNIKGRYHLRNNPGPSNIYT